jgi:putative peptide zinc metalloprotease protein
MYTRDSVVAVRPFSRQEEGEEVIIGSTETGVFLAVPREAVELLELLAQGKSVGEVSDYYAATHGEAPDLDDFLGLLEAKGMVAPLDVPGGSVTNATDRRAGSPRYHFSNFPQSLARCLFNPATVILCLITAALAAVAVLADPWLAPAASDWIFPDRRALSWTILLAASYATIFVHEMGHLVAARALGIDSRMGIGNRMWYLVAETDLTGLWSLPKRRRYLPMLAGMMIDAFSGGILILALFLYRRNWLSLTPFGVRMLRAMAFTYLMRIAWQFFLFVRTDLYYAIATLFNCRNLLGDTQGFLRNLLSRWLPWIRPVNQSAIPPAERRMIRLYTVFWLGGRVWALGVLFLVTLPVAVSYISSLGDAFHNGYRANPSDFLDAVLLAAYFLVPTLAGLMLWIAGMARRERI